MGTKRAWSDKDRAKQHQYWLAKNSATAKPAASPLIDSSSTEHPKIIMEYYAGAFMWFGLQLLEKFPNGIAGAMQARRTFWHLVPDGEYETQQAHQLIDRYLESLERQLAEEISKHSISYWLYFYRRTAPEAAGPNGSPATTVLVRQRLEAAFQKYAAQGADRSIAWSDEVEARQVLACVPTKWRPPKMIRILLAGPRDLVLTDFTLEDFIQLYRCEQLAYEIWRCGASMRITSKGACLIVDHTTQDCFFDGRTPELNKLVEIYDARENPFIASATATVFGQDRTALGIRGMVLLPHYNVAREDSASYEELFGRVGITLDAATEFNFHWVLFDIRAYCSAHAFLSGPFARKHGFRFEVVLVVLMALLRRMREVWVKAPTFMYQAFQRAYSGPSLFANVRQIVSEDAGECADLLGVDRPFGDELERAVNFLTLSEQKKALISMQTGGPCFLFIPSESGRVIVDFAWVASNLHYLFLGVSLREVGAKGKLLETLVAGTSALPTGECKAFDGSRREVDAAFRIGKILVIVECKANARSIAYERGDLAALQYRRAAFEEALRQVDDKVVWFLAHPKGKNYDIADVEAILPVVVTPFKEFMPSLENRYWIRPELPRVLMPHELKNFLEDPNLESDVRSSRSAVFKGVLIEPQMEKPSPGRE